MFDAIFALDIMHDIREGVDQYEMKLLSESLSESGLSEADLFSRMSNFDYG